MYFLAPGVASFVCCIRHGIALQHSGRGEGVCLSGPVQHHELPPRHYAADHHLRHQCK